MKNKEFYLAYYYQVIHFQISQCLIALRKNKFPYQKEYWQQDLNRTLISKRKYIALINNSSDTITDQQYTLF